MTDKPKRSEPIKNSTIKVDPMPGVVIVELLNIESKVAKDLKKKSPDLLISEDAIKQRMKQIIDTTGDILQVWDQHPDQAVIIAIPTAVAEEKELRVNDRIAFHRTEHALRPIIYHKKRYYAIYPSEILFRYLTDEV